MTSVTRPDWKTALVSIFVSALGLVPITAAGQPTIPLDPIVVSGQGDAEATRDRYYDRTSTSATKTNTPVIETPQSVSTVTRKQIDDQNPQSVGNALRYTAGVLSEPDATTRYDSVFLRGFGGFGLSTSYVSFLDGLKLPRGQAFATQSIDPFVLDRIDVIKGPSALLYGQISPGGLVNQISRQPSAQPYNEFRLEGGSYGRLQSGITSQGPLDAKGLWQYSFTAIGRMSGTRYDGVDEERVAVAPALAWQPSADTRLTISGYFQRDPEGGYFNSILPRSLAPAQYQPFLNSKLNIGDPGFDSFQRDQSGIGYNLEHRFSEAVSVRSNFRYSQVDIDFQSLQMSAPMTMGLIPRHAIRSVEDASGVAFDNQAQFGLRTGILVHKVLAGIDYQDSQSNWLYRFGGASPLDVTNPQYYQPAGPLVPIIDRHQTLSQTGLYVQDQISLGRLRAVVGVRHDWTEQVTDDRRSSTNHTQSSEKSSYRAGLLYLFDNGIAPYVSYSSSFEPVIGADVAGTPFVPTTGEQYEAGIKYQPTFLDALFTISAFDIRQQNVLTPGPAIGVFVQQGAVRSRGLELEARGKTASNLELIAVLTLLDTEVTRSSVASVIGKRPQAVPNYFGAVWANYAFNSGAFDGLTVGGGIRFVASSFGNDANTLVSPGYTLVDAALRYNLAKIDPALKGFEATLNVTNLLNKEYYSSCSFDFYCQFGNGRLALAGVRYRW